MDNLERAALGQQIDNRNPYSFLLPPPHTRRKPDGRRACGAAG
jgi:hypothetical protein